MSHDPGGTFGFLMTPQFTLGALSSAIEPLRLANYLSGEKLYEWYLLSEDGKPVTSSADIAIAPAFAVDDARPLTTVFVCGGLGSNTYESKKVASWLRRLASRGTNIGALCAGSLTLARMGLLDGYRCSIHWEYLPGFSEDFPDVDVREEIYAIDRNRFTCAGGTASTDLMLAFIARQHGRELAAQVSEELVVERIRGDEDSQRMALRLRLAVSQPKLLESIMVMAENVEAPLSQVELADEVGVSTRQLERLFQKYLSCTPSRYYLEMRLNRARALLQQTSMSVMNVALATGFVSASHFSKSYRLRFGHAPRQEKRGVPDVPPQPMPGELLEE